MHSELPTLSVYGAGKLGQTLAHLWRARKLVNIGQVLCRTQAAADAAVAFIGSGRGCTPDAEPEAADFWLISPPDAHITEAALWLAPAASEGCTLFHCAGSLNHQALSPALPAALASVHPVHAFTHAQQPPHGLEGVACVAEGQPAALAKLKPLFEQLGCHWFNLANESEHAKALYHAATVSASNHLVSLLDQALRMAERAGLSRANASRILAPLARNNVENILHGQAKTVLTGPVSRGDSATLAKHFAAQSTLAMSETDQQLYAALARATLAIAKQQLACEQDKLAGIEALLARQAH
ncbi:DUF2520 domain-containing protein [Simiduia sp. 21SJ11W-1]|uniref:Rossmann-like and DUF2520 domain-containing protein n=1 Tax=Simiduia sp. 21SJ11W-1 TaxID=2909669 RepID=UPI00209CA8D4|nr:Rossmann-like and DUF2520 domain-containing protein [Simiduia sp. 21SJ11W-1]UTA49294.1 DUF2520 domain-containing protein [Simiduia sp. 21SJ11W-1]